MSQFMECPPIESFMSTDVVDRCNVLVALQPYVVRCSNDEHQPFGILSKQLNCSSLHWVLMCMPGIIEPILNDILPMDTFDLISVLLRCPISL